MKKLIVSMITLVGIVHFFTPYDKVLADQATSTAGIRFVEGNDSSTDPNDNEKNPSQPGGGINPSQPGGEINLPQTGGKASAPYYAMGIGLIGLASLLLMKSNIKNVEERGN
ncbi:LPXTG cell wall anchor domain-containing protein [Bacillus pseudomycoides]|uniref:LPXTG cell wall anchor domain-containing protein n=1 Tax=Bacillus bingmayongensis TaxID=1150157 RepID=A0ABU5JSJ9_9BACI|nr:LPXTG cell wall anchor domain-containing protein [Bacillus pseudomycoides]